MSGFRFLLRTWRQEDVMTRPVLGIALWSAMLVSAAAEAGTCPPTLPSQVRVMDCRLAALLADGLTRSATLRQLVDRIAALDGIVYVVFEPTPPVNKTLRGALSQPVAVSGRVRLLRIVVRDNRGDAALATVAHELRHATELLEEPGALTDAAVAALFLRIGIELRPGVFETDAAIVSERAVFRELHESRRRPAGQ
jgi:hypothetical protein